MVLLGNIITFAAAILMVCIGLIKEKNKMILAQCVQFALYAAANFVLGGVMGAVTNFVSMARNIVSVKREFDLKWKIVFSVVQLGLGIAANNEGFLGWLPIIAALSLTWLLDTKDEIVLKGIFMFGQVLWVFYDLRHKNYVGVFFDVFSFVTNIIGIKMIMKDRKSAAGKNDIKR